ncbi:hypothetical protein NOX90_03690 [Wolbachia endosymbiont of Anurida maritima]|uniref:hypothetical protein n=1 Tax=Wolbachia endosymbiont of Anurida maritima TaxID=2850562 RepID=UPI0035D08C64
MFNHTRSANISSEVNETHEIRHKHRHEHSRQAGQNATERQRGRRAVNEENMASSAKRVSNPMNNLVNWVKEKSGELVSNIINGLYRSTAEQPENLSSNAESPEYYENYDRIQDIDFEYMEQYDRSNRKQKHKTIDIHSKKHGKQEKQQRKEVVDVAKCNQIRNINQSKVISTEKQQWSNNKQTSSINNTHIGRKQPEISERKHHMATQKQFSHQLHNSNQMMIGGTHKWCERISNESRKMIGNANQKQQNSYSQSGNFQSRAPLTQVTAQVDIPSTLFAVNMITRCITKVKDQQPHSYKDNKMPKGSCHISKTQAETLGLKVGVKRGDITWYR